MKKLTNGTKKRIKQINVFDEKDVNYVMSEETKKRVLQLAEMYNKYDRGMVTQGEIVISFKDVLSKIPKKFGTRKRSFLQRLL